MELLYVIVITNDEEDVERKSNSDKERDIVSVVLGWWSVCLFVYREEVFDKASLFTWNYSRKSKVFQQILYNNIIIVISSINN